jgi:hypothetical protein
MLFISRKTVSSSLKKYIFLCLRSFTKNCRKSLSGVEVLITSLFPFLLPSQRVTKVGRRIYILVLYIASDLRIMDSQDYFGLHNRCP